MRAQQPFSPAYRKLHESGELDARVEEALAHLEKCDLCPWNCGINRSIGRLGACKTSRRARVSAYSRHMGEESVLRGQRGSGTIFFSNCNMRCQYCQNYAISQQGEGRTLDASELAGMMLELQAMGCHNVNLVSPSHVIAQIIEAVAIAARQGLNVPLVYNTGGYDSITGLKLLDGIVDIYLPDMKYSDTGIARQYSLIKNYVANNQEAVREMYRQVGNLVTDARGIAQRGLLVRHLVLPGGLAGTAEIARFLVEEISPDVSINIMGQYRPEFKTRQGDSGQLSRPVTAEEITEAFEIARAAGLHRFANQRSGWPAI